MYVLRKIQGDLDEKYAIKLEKVCKLIDEYRKEKTR